MHQRRTIKNNKDNNLLYISKTNIGDGFVTSYHSHPNSEILLITNGEGTIITKEKKYPIKEKDIFIINTYTEHYEVSDTIVDFMAIGVDEFNAYLKDNFNDKIIKISLKDDEYQKILLLYKLIYLDSNNNDQDSLITNSFNSIITLIKRHEKVNFNSTAKSQYSSLIASVIDIIENNYYSNISLNDLASHLSISKSTLAHQFKKETNSSIIEYKIKCQLKEACNLLKITNMQISDLATVVGFNSISYFTKVFKNEFNVTPKIYRKLNKK